MMLAQYSTERHIAAQRSTSHHAARRGDDASAAVDAGLLLEMMSENGTKNGDYDAENAS
jgi:hypothetical protein